MEFTAFGENGDIKRRATKLDEGLDILAGLWTGKPFRYAGEHYQLSEVTFLPKPLQSPRIPIWVACFWPNRKPLQRAARYDGVVPAPADWTQKIAPKDVKEISAHVAKYRRSPAPFDIVIGGQTPSDSKKAAETIRPYVEAGMTWWSEDINGWRGPPEEMRERIRQGPPET